MEDDSFQCTKCGDILRSPQITFFREAIKSGSTIAGGIKCARCGTVYSAQEIAGKRKATSEAEGFIEACSNLAKNPEFRSAVLEVLLPPALFVTMLVLIWWRPFSFLYLWVKIILSIVALVLVPCVFIGAEWLASKWKSPRKQEKKKGASNGP